MKLFEIPVYGLSRNVLKKRVEQRRTKLINASCLSEEDLKNEITLCGLSAFPKDQWDYNHIVGYIVIYHEGNNIRLNWYTAIEAKAYHWSSDNKKFFALSRPSGFHSYIGNIKTGDELRSWIHELLSRFIRDLKMKHRGYFVDLEAFHNLDTLIDYSRLL